MLNFEAATWPVVLYSGRLADPERTVRQIGKLLDVLHGAALQLELVLEDTVFLLQFLRYTGERKIERILAAGIDPCSDAIHIDFAALDQPTTVTNPMQLDQAIADPRV